MLPALGMDTFETRLRCAVQAGWRTLLIGVAFVTLVWLVYLRLVNTRPEWFLSLLGPDVTWSNLATVTLWVTAWMKVGLYTLGLMVVWGALWSARLRKARASAQKPLSESGPLIGPTAMARR